MKKKIFALLLCTLISVCAFAGCEQGGNTESKKSDSSSVVMVDGTFDIEAVRNSINIKGHKFTVPQKLSELEDGLKYEFVDEEFGDGLYMVEISDENGLILKSIARNAHKKSKKAFFCNIGIEDSDSDVAGIVPFVSTKEDVLKKFGEPDDKQTFSTISEEKEVYKYGFKESDNGYTYEGKFMTIKFSSSDIVEGVVINYTE